MVVSIYSVDALGPSVLIDDLKPETMDLCILCKRCERIILVPVDWSLKNKLTMILKCKNNKCKQQLKLEEIDRNRFKCTRRSLAVFTVDGDWKLKSKYGDDDVRWNAKIFGKVIPFKTKAGGNWKIPLATYREIAPRGRQAKTVKREKEEDEEKEDTDEEEEEEEPYSDSSDSSDDPDKRDAVLLRQKRFDTDPWQDHGTWEVSKNHGTWELSKNWELSKSSGSKKDVPLMPSVDNLFLLVDMVEEKK